MTAKEALELAQRLSEHYRDRDDVKTELAIQSDLKWDVMLSATHEGKSMTLTAAYDSDNENEAVHVELWFGLYHDTGFDTEYVGGVELLESSMIQWFDQIHVGWLAVSRAFALR